MKKTLSILLLQFLAFSAFTQTKPMLKGEFQNNCGLSCYETFVFDGEHTYQYSIWGDTVVREGEYVVSDNTIKLTPVKFNGDTDKIKELKIHQRGDGTIVLKRKERISLFRKRTVVYLKTS